MASRWLSVRATRVARPVRHWDDRKSDRGRRLGKTGSFWGDDRILRVFDIKFGRPIGRLVFGRHPGFPGDGRGGQALNANGSQGIRDGRRSHVVVALVEICVIVSAVQRHRRRRLFEPYTLLYPVRVLGHVDVHARQAWGGALHAPADDAADEPSVPVSVHRAQERSARVALRHTRTKILIKIVSFPPLLAPVSPVSLVDSENPSGGGKTRSVNAALRRTTEYRPYRSNIRRSVQRLNKRTIPNVRQESKTNRVVKPDVRIPSRTILFASIIRQLRIRTKRFTFRTRNACDRNQ